jgi:hypothetical protein
MAEIKVIIDENTLAVKVEVEGMKGPGCLQLIEDFQKDLGLKTRAERKKPEFQTARNRLRQGR